ncbi:hypothetical protein K2X89_03870 [Myxococcota bacterium]|nr:hypothetical protein [Myxococcota bacterium]
MFGWDGGLGIELESEELLEFEFGSLVAALSAWTEDETELELQLRALVESGRYRIAIGCDPAPTAGRGHGTGAAEAVAAPFEIDGLTRS